MLYLPSNKLPVSQMFAIWTQVMKALKRDTTFFFPPPSSLQISESPEYAYWRYCGGAGVHGVCVGIAQQGYTPQAEETVPNHICSGHHAV